VACVGGLDFAYRPDFYTGGRKIDSKHTLIRGVLRDRYFMIVLPIGKCALEKNERYITNMTNFWEMVI